MRSISFGKKLWRQTTIFSSNTGFTLIEIMIAITVFAIGILALNVMQTSSISGNSASQSIANETNWASEKIEEIINMAWDDTDIEDGDNVSETNGNNVVRWETTDYASLNNRVKNIQISVTTANGPRASSPPTVFNFIKADTSY